MVYVYIKESSMLVHFSGGRVDHPHLPCPSNTRLAIEDIKRDQTRGD